MTSSMRHRALLFAVSVTVLVLSGIPASATPHGNAYRGPTAQGPHMNFTATPGGVTAVAWGEIVTCTASPAANYIDGPFHATVDASGRFAIAYKGSGVIKVYGRIRGTRASGTFSDTFSPFRGNVCRTGTVHWNATQITHPNRDAVDPASRRANVRREVRSGRRPSL
jgi:hypothetical protein